MDNFCLLDGPDKMLSTENKQEILHITCMISDCIEVCNDCKRQTHLNLHFVCMYNYISNYNDNIYISY